jgi:hypothetical protein
MSIVSREVSEYMANLGRKFTSKKRASCAINGVKARAALAEKWKDPAFRKMMARKQRAAANRRKKGQAK